jgi:hypothetical protein
MAAIDQERSMSKVPATRSDVARRDFFFKLIYLSAIGIATLGWLWLIAWCAMELMAQIVEGG